MSSLTSLELTRVDNVGRDILDIQSYLVHSDSKMSMMRCFFFVGNFFYPLRARLFQREVLAAFWPSSVDFVWTCMAIAAFARQLGARLVAFAHATL